MHRISKSIQRMWQFAVNTTGLVILPEILDLQMEWLFRRELAAHRISIGGMFIFPGNYQIIDEESTGGMRFGRKSTAHEC
jgi:hypothetical protein